MGWKIFGEKGAGGLNIFVNDMPHTFFIREVMKTVLDNISYIRLTDAKFHAYPITALEYLKVTLKIFVLFSIHDGLVNFSLYRNTD